MSEHDDITGIFDNLTPEDFITPDRSCQRISISDECSFDEFVSAQMALLRYGFAVCDGKVNPMTALATPDTVAIYQADDNENLGQYISRMSEEARRLGARWVFFYKRTLVAKAHTNGGKSSVDDDNLMSAALKAGEAWETVYWYAARTDGDPKMRHGYANISDQKIIDFAEAPLQPNEFLSKILEP